VKIGDAYPPLLSLIDFTKMGSVRRDFTIGFLSIAKLFLNPLQASFSVTDTFDREGNDGKNPI
jgi:hypothetical protein